jgi:O-antigen/teichoic acid export membrane protein
MDLKGKIARNISFLGVAEAISNVLSFLIVILITRSLGVEGLGVYSFAFAFAGLFIMFYDFGISTYFIREAARSKKGAEKHFAHYASLKLLFCLLAMILPMITILFLKRSADVILIVYFASISVFIQNYSYVMRNAFIAFQEMKYEALLRLVERGISFSLGIYVLLAGYGLLPFMIVLVLSNLISLVYAVMLLKKIKLKFRLSFDSSAWKNMLGISWPFWLQYVFVQLYFHIDTVMLTFMKGYEASGIYNAAYKLINVISKVPVMIGLVLFPVMSNLYLKTSKSLLKRVIEKGIHVLIVLSLPLMIGVTLLSDRLIFFAYGEGFSESSVVLSILIWTTFFTFLSYMMGWFFNAIGRHHAFAYVTGFCLIVNFVLNFILIPKYSYIGASIATIGTAAINLLLLVWFNEKAGYTLKIVRKCVKPMIASIVMGGGILLMGGVHLLILIPAAVMVYFGLLWMMGDITLGEIKGIFGKKMGK